jgi:hypothetical protein
MIFPYIKFYINSVKSKPCGPCLKPQFLTKLTSSHSHCPKEKDKWAKPRNHVIKLKSLSTLPENNVSRFFPRLSFFTYSSAIILYLSFLPSDVKDVKETESQS